MPDADGLETALMGRVAAMGEHGHVAHAELGAVDPDHHRRLWHPGHVHNVLGDPLRARNRQSRGEQKASKRQAIGKQ